MYLIYVSFSFLPCLSQFQCVSSWKDQLRAHLRNCQNQVLNKKSHSDKGLLYIVKHKLPVTWIVPCFFLLVLTCSVVFVPSLPFFSAVRFVKGTSSSELSEKKIFFLFLLILSGQSKKVVYRSLSSFALFWPVVYHLSCHCRSPHI